jgi:N-methylhydantoinase A/oxoprolinase/acetone carboxylase beta subunit
VEEGRADRARERRGAVTALIIIEGFRHAVEIGYEHRFEQHRVVRAAYSSVN